MKPKADYLSFGYDIIRLKARQCNPYLMSCFNCNYFYQAVGDEEELCQNPDVLEYDMINTSNTIYCLQWKPVLGNKKESRVGFKNGVSLSGHKKEIKKTGRKSSKRTQR